MISKIILDINIPNININVILINLLSLRLNSYFQIFIK
jgi:hypothetical protein